MNLIRLVGLKKRFQDALKIYILLQPIKELWLGKRLNLNVIKHYFHSLFDALTVVKCGQIGFKGPLAVFFVNFIAILLCGRWLQFTDAVLSFQAFPILD